jgi:hypothetical protein
MQEADHQGHAILLFLLSVGYAFFVLEEVIIWADFPKKWSINMENSKNMEQGVPEVC